MNRKHEPKEKAGGSTTRYLKETNDAFEPRPTNTGFQSFLKWFRKNERERLAKKNSSATNYHRPITENGYLHKSPDLQQTPPGSPNLDTGISSSSSCDSVFSTATTSFSFIPPNQYRPFGELSQPEKLIAAGPDTDTYRNRLYAHKNAKEKDRKLELTLRKKYNIFDCDTLTSISSFHCQNSNQYYTNRSLPQTGLSQSVTESTIDQLSLVRRKSHRRTVSDSSKDKKAGAYVHVKGKRKAPKPPISENSRNSTLRASGTLSPTSTLGRKKRRAPPPPLQSPVCEEVPTVLANGLFDDEEIQAIIGTRSSQFPNSVTELTRRINESKMNEGKPIDNFPCTDTLRLERGVLKSNRETIRNSINDTKLEDKSPPQLSPSSISPRPWYKRSPAANKDYAIPFKKEVVLKTMEKRKNKNSSKDLESPQLPEVGFCRNSSLFDSFFSRLNSDKSEEATEKRKSGIMMPNISELDREAAEIVSKEQESEKAKLKLEEENFFFNLSKMNEVSVAKTATSSVTSESVPQIKRTSTKDLISKFEKSNPTVSSSIVDPSNRLSGSEHTNLKYKLEQTNRHCSMVHSIFSNVTKHTQVKPPDDSKLQKPTGSVEEDDTAIKEVWICPYCTLENPHWRLICEVCERFKPFEKKYFGSSETSQQPAAKPLTNNKGIIAQLRESEKPTKDQKNDWESKAEKVMKYFRPKSTMNSLSKSASETSVGRSSPFSRKTNSPSRLIDSPKFTLKSKLADHPDIVRENCRNQPYKTNEKKENLLDSKEVVVATVTPVLIGPSPKNHEADSSSTSSSTTTRILPTIEEIRQARLAKFSGASLNISADKVSSSEKNKSTDNIEIAKTSLNDPNALEKEKERLREMIRAMNARALAEKYPVLQKSVSLNETESLDLEAQPSRSILSLDLNQTSNIPKLGAIKKILSRNPYIEDKEIADNTNYSNTKSDKDRIVKVSSFSQTSGLSKPLKTDVLQLPSPIQELNEEDRSPISPTKSNYYAGFKEDVSMNMFDNYLDDSAGHIDNDLKQLEEISQQLNTQKGLEDFKATLRFSNKKISDTNTLALNKILKNLETAIAHGEHELAAILAMDLAKMKVSLSVTKQHISPESPGNTKHDKSIAIVDVYVEDKESRKGPIQLSLSPTISVAELKQTIFKDFQIPINVQRWVLNNRQALGDFQILSDFGIKDKSIMHLYITPKKTEPFLNNDKKLNTTVQASVARPESPDIDNEIGAQSLLAKSDSKLSDVHLKLDWACPLCTLFNSPNRSDCVACTEKRPENFIVSNVYKVTSKDFELPPELKKFLDDDISDNKVPKIRQTIEKGNDLNKITVNRKSADMFNITVQPKTKIDLQKMDLPKLGQINLELTKTTATKSSNLKPIYQKSIVMTAITTSPNITKNKYRGVDNYNPHVTKNVEMTKSVNKSSVLDHNSLEQNDELNAPNLKETKIKIAKDDCPVKTSNQMTEAIILESKNEETASVSVATFDNKKKNSTLTKENQNSSHYAELLSLDNSHTIPNTEPFECPICFAICAPAEGVILKDCLHTFCKECLANTIKYSEDAEIKCPYMDREYSCDSILSEREIKALVTKDEYEQHLAVSLRVAENRTENAFHCKTPNCRGWCIYEDNVNQFKCPICQVINCLTCRVVHDGLNCKQYQDRMSSDCDISAEARRTKDMLAEMIEKGEAMNCPTCQVVLMKKWGCDWLKCSMCKTEICWVTRGVRWGPEGKGDTSAGCKCGVNGVKCHPKCNYCH